MGAPRIVRDVGELEKLVALLRGSSRLALDTEFLTEKNYFPRLCLIQVAAGDVVGAIDPLECRRLDPLADLLSGDLELVLHAGEQDLPILSRAVGSVPGKVFDTQVAAAFLGHGQSIGYGRLVETCCGVQLKRSRAYTDWSRRPLEPEQIEYALDDVRYLQQCRDHLVRELESRGRLGWVREECAAARQSALEVVEPEDRWRRISGAQRVDGLELAVLQDLAAWREQEAMRRDVPRGRIMPDRVVVEIARRKPDRASRLRGMRGLHPREAKRSGEAIVEVVRQARERPRSDWPRWPEKPELADDPGVPAVATLLDAFLRARSLELELSSRLLANRRDLEKLVRIWLTAAQKDEAPAATGASVPVLEGWRREVAGEAMLGLLRGEVRLGVARGGDGRGDGLKIEIEPAAVEPGTTADPDG